MAAIVQVESGGNPLAIDDDTTRRLYYPSDRASAEALANHLIEAGHLLDIGIAQVDSMNFAHLGVTVHTAFDACTNLRAGSAILSGDYDFDRHPQCLPKHRNIEDDLAAWALESAAQHLVRLARV
jgi:type IV secretion system protein VirB1